MRRIGKGGGEDVCYFGKVQSTERVQVPYAKRRKQHRSFPAYPITVRGEDRCYFVC